MRISKIQLFTACAVAGIVTSAQAQATYSSAELRGAGDASLMIVQAPNCVGNPGKEIADDHVGNRFNRLGSNNGAISIITQPQFSWPVLILNNPSINCEKHKIQRKFQDKYVATGPLFARRIWGNFSRVFFR